MVHTKIIGLKKVSAGETLDFTFSQKAGYAVQNVKYTVGNTTESITNGSYSISNVTGDVNVEIYLTKVTNYAITFHGSNTTFTYGTQTQAFLDDTPNSPLRGNYNAGSTLSFQLKGNTLRNKDAKALNKLVITVGNQNAVGADIPIKWGDEATTVLPNGIGIVVRKQDQPSQEDGLPEYSVTIKAAAGNEIHGNIDIATNYKTEANSEVWAINLVGVDPLSCWNGSYESGKLNPTIHSFGSRNERTDFYVYINIKEAEGYKQSAPKVTVTCDGEDKSSEFELKRVEKVNGGILNRDPNGMNSAFKAGCEWYFIIPKGGNLKDIRVSVTAERTTEQFALRYQYNGGTNAEGNSTDFVDANTNYIAGENISVGDGKAEDPTKIGFAFAGWTLGDKVYQTGEPFELKKSDIGTLAMQNPTTGNYEYTFVAKWVPVDMLNKAKYTIKISLIDENGKKHGPVCT